MAHAPDPELVPPASALEPGPDREEGATAAAPGPAPDAAPYVEGALDGAQPPAEPEVAGAAPDGSAEAGAAGGLPAVLAPPPRPRPGTLLSGTVVAVAADHLLVDVGGKSDGVVPLAEAALAPDASLEQAYAPGAAVQVVVTGYDPQEGTPRLSVRRAEEVLAWRRLEAAFRAEEVVEAPVVEVVKGGIVLRPGVRAFMPASHVERGHVADLSPYVGQTLRCKIIELDRGRGKVVLSRKAVMEQEAALRKEALWASLREGQVCQGTVKSLTDFGAFVDLGGADGLLHISAMAWGRIEHPSEVLRVGDPVTVKVLKLDPEREKISLGLKQLQADPWNTVVERYPVGEVVEGTVARLASFGAFVELEPGVDGLVHVSQLADRHVREPGEVVREGELVRAKVLRVVPAEHRISLSMRDVDQGERLDRAAAAAPSPDGPAGGGVTLGDVVGDLGSLLNRAGADRGEASADAGVTGGATTLA